MKVCPKRCSSINGFTLIEVSIVLVIIGLIVGGVLVGRDLIAAAQIRSTVSQIESFKSAVYAFKNKYGQYPGDISSVYATSFGFTSRTGARGHGNNDDKIEGCSANATVFGCETALFWKDLSQAGLIEQSITAATDALTAIPAGSVESYLPKSDMPTGAHFIVYNNTPSWLGSGNHLALSIVASSPGTGVYASNGGLLPITAFQIDSKMDDGIAERGNVRSSASMTAFVSSTFPSFGFGEICVNGLDITVPYHVTHTDPECFVGFRSIF